MMNRMVLNFSRKIFTFQLIAVTILCLLPVIMGGIMLSTLLFSLVLLLLSGCIFLIKSKIIYYEHNNIIIKYILLRKIVKYNLAEVERIQLHRKIAERDDNYIIIKDKCGQVKKFSFLFIRSDLRDVFFKELSKYCIVEFIK